MQTNQGPDRLCQAKSHVQTACESHDLNMEFCGFKQLHVTNSYARIKVYRRSPSEGGTATVFTYMTVQQISLCLSSYFYGIFFIFLCFIDVDTGQVDTEYV